MSDTVRRFVEACAQANGVAADRGCPPFTTGLRSETPLNSAPYVFDMDGFRDAFGTNAHRRGIIADCEAALDRLGRCGIGWQMLLIGGSFLRSGETPADLDGLVLYSIDPDGPDGIDAIWDRWARSGNDPHVDFKFCPADVHPMILIKRVLFFSSLFGYDRETRSLIHGTVLLVPGRTPRSPIRRPAA